MRELDRRERKCAEELLRSAERRAEWRKPIYDLGQALPFEASQKGYRLLDYTEAEGADPIILISPKGDRVQEWREFIPTHGDVDDALVNAHL